MMEKAKLKDMLFLQAVLILYSFASVCSKLASGYEFLSSGFILWYGLVIVCLAVYALLWQQVLKRMPLTTAFANKAVTIIWGMLWGVLIFRESITPAMIIGSVVIIAGIWLVVTSDE